MPESKSGALTNLATPQLPLGLQVLRPKRGPNDIESFATWQALKQKIFAFPAQKYHKATKPVVPAAIIPNDWQPQRTIHDRYNEASGWAANPAATQPAMPGQAC